MSMPIRIPWSNLPRRRIFAVLLAILLGVAAPFTTPASPLLDVGQRNTLAVLYSNADEPEPGQFAKIIDAIRTLPSVVVLPVNLALNDLYAEAAASRWQLANKIAMADGEGAIAVVYPDIGEPYRSVFTKIIEGIENRSKSPIVSYAVGAGADSTSLKSTLKAKDVRVVICLGRQGMQAADALARDFGVVVGGVVAVPEEEAKDISVISLSPDPALLFSKLRNLAPAVRRVHVVYDPRQNNWLIRLAREAARNQGLDLVAMEARDLKSAVRIYQDILANANPERDAIWLPQDQTTVEDGAVLPLVLQESWERRLPVISSSFGHVKRGALFSLYPDNLGLGRNLAGSALGLLSNGEQSNRGVAPLKDVQTAVNLRTAKHLGLSFSSQQQRGFDLVFSGQ
jgi:putative tryptophan/tyrosine transport system substrate-binding protein